MKRLVNIGAPARILLDSNTDSCSRCGYRDPWKDYCRFFKAGLIRVGQNNGGFHHSRFAECHAAEKNNDHLYMDIAAQEKLYAEMTFLKNGGEL